MAEPKVLDVNGKELRVGSRVERVLPNGEQGGVIGVVTWARRQVDVTFIAGATTFGTARNGLLGRTRTCNSLTLIDTEED